MSRVTVVHPQRLTEMQTTKSRAGIRTKAGAKAVNRIKGSVLPESILQAAARLFIERGFDGTSMYEIAQALGVTRTAIYYYYKNKQEILVALTENITRVAAQLAEEAAQHKDLSPTQALRHIVSRHVGLIISHGEQFRIVERSEDRLPPRLRAAASDYRRGVLANFSAVIERGIKSGDFRPTDPRVAALAIIGMCNWTAWWFRPGGRKTRDEVADIISDMAILSLTRHPLQGVTESNIGSVLRELRNEIGYLEQRIAEGTN
jgi:AcrR family transcriptional regulator